MRLHSPGGGGGGPNLECVVLLWILQECIVETNYYIKDLGNNAVCERAEAYQSTARSRIFLVHLVNLYSLVFTQFYQRNGMKYAISDADQLSVEILVGQQRMACSIEYNDLESKTAYNSVKCAFTVRRSGLYAINIRLGPTPIRGSPFFKEFMPGKILSCIFR